MGSSTTQMGREEFEELRFSRLPPSCWYQAEGRRRIQLHQQTDHFPSRYSEDMVDFIQEMD